MMLSILIALLHFFTVPHVALVDGTTEHHAGVIRAVLRDENVPFTYYSLQDLTMTEALDRVTANGEEIVIIEACFTWHGENWPEQIKMLSENAMIFIPACFHGDTILPEYADYSVVVGAIDKRGNKLYYLNNGPEVDVFVYACDAGPCSTSEAAARAGAQELKRRYYGK